MRASTIKVSRTKLIDVLKSKLVEIDKNREEKQKEDQDKFIQRRDEKIAELKKELAKISKYKTFADVPVDKDGQPVSQSDRWGILTTKRYRNSEKLELERMIRILELSGEETLSIGPTSDLYFYL